MAISKDELIIQRIDDLRDSVEKADDNTNQRLDEYNKQLEIHVAGVETLKDLHIQNSERIKVLEEPAIARKYLSSTVLKISALLGAVITIIKLIEMFKS